MTNDPTPDPPPAASTPTRIPASPRVNREQDLGAPPEVVEPAVTHHAAVALHPPPVAGQRLAGSPRLRPEHALGHRGEQPPAVVVAARVLVVHPPQLRLAGLRKCHLASAHALALGS